MKPEKVFSITTENCDKRVSICNDGFGLSLETSRHTNFTTGQRIDNELLDMLADAIGLYKQSEFYEKS